jgi:hypothetical protein
MEATLYCRQVITTDMGIQYVRLFLDPKAPIQDMADLELSIRNDKLKNNFTPGKTYKLTSSEV